MNSPGGVPVAGDRNLNLNLIVTVTDPLTGHTETAVIPPHDYLVITTGECTYSVQTYPTGTHQVTIRGRRA